MISISNSKLIINNYKTYNKQTTTTTTTLRQKAWSQKRIFLLSFYITYSYTLWPNDLKGEASSSLSLDSMLFAYLHIHQILRERQNFLCIHKINCTVFLKRRLLTLKFFFDHFLNFWSSRSSIPFLAFKLTINAVVDNFFSLPIFSFTCKVKLALL